jgi:hypothetical protein
VIPFAVIANSRIPVGLIITPPSGTNPMNSSLKGLDWPVLIARSLMTRD